MPSFSHARRRPVPTRPLLFACSLLSAVALDAACTTEAVQPKVIALDGKANSAIGLYLIRDDSLDPAVSAQQLPSYRVAVDGNYLVYNGSAYVQAAWTTAWDLPVAAGSHVVALVDGQGQPVVASAVENKPFAPLPLPPYRASVVFFGNPTAFGARVLIDDPAALPAGAVHLRVVNALVDHQPLQVVQCLTDLDASSSHTVATATCTPVGAPTAYGDVFDTDAGADVVNKIGFYWAAPGTGDAAVRGINAGGPSIYVPVRPSNGFVTRIPFQVAGPASPCPSCILSSF
jgi:hypothetical protein